MEEDNKKNAEAQATLTVLFSLTNLAGALPEDFEKLKALQLSAHYTGPKKATQKARVSRQLG